MMQRSAVITGSTKGWGLAVAQGLASNGVRVVVNGRNDDVITVVRSITEAGGQAIGAQYATDTPEGIDRLLQQAIDEYGEIDIWVNSLGLERPQSLLSMDLATWNDILRVELTSYFLGTQLAARQMVKQGRGGRILNVIGGGAYGIPGASAHAASKGGALAATYSWATELIEYGITVNGIRGGVQSPSRRAYLEAMGYLNADAPSDAATLSAHGYYTLEEAAPLAVWLASESVDDVTGFHIGIDGPRIRVYDRVRTVLDINEEGGWTEENLEQKLRPALRQAALSADAVSQRRPPDGRQFSFDDRASPLR